MKKYLVIFTIIIAIIGIGYFLFGQKESENFSYETEEQEVVEISKTTLVEDEEIEEKDNNQTQEISKKTISQTIKQDVPFIVQAPFGNWADPDFQNGCEEASMLMAMGWINNVAEISAEKAREKIKDLVNFEKKFLGYSVDTDLFDIHKIFQSYFKYENVKVKEDITIEDIKDELQEGNIILIPAFGHALKNPNYTPPGPITHMLVIIGYNPENKKFITNDPGTRNGKEYEYSEEILFNAIWQYPSGEKHSKAQEKTDKKDMLIIESDVKNLKK